MTDMADLRAQAKALGINSFGMKKDALAAAIAAKSSDSPAREETRPETRDDAPRQRRTPLGTARQKLSYPPRPGYVRRWFNDTMNRIHDATQAGYEHVEEDADGRRVKLSRLVGTKEDGTPMAAYLMEIRQEFYEEDHAEKQRAVDEIDAQMMRRNDPDGVGGADQGRFYTPSDGRKMSVEVG